MKMGKKGEACASSESTLHEEEHSVLKPKQQHIKEHKKKSRKQRRKPNWISRTFCASPTSAEVLDHSTDEARECENESCGHADAESGRDSPYDVNVQIEDDGSFTQIEVAPSHEDDALNLSNDSSLGAIDNLRSPKPANGHSQVIITKDATVIDNLLENNQFICAGLNSWYGSSDSVESDEAVLVNDVPDLPRNRSSHPAGRKKRIQNLRVNLTPFDLDEAVLVRASINSKRHGYNLDKKVRSFSAYKGALSPTSVTNISSYQMFDSLPSCGTSPKYESSMADWDDKSDVDLCYDSDPDNLLLPQTCPKLKKQVELETDENCPTVSDLMGIKMLLIWHRASFANAKSVAINAWIEHGSCINSGLIHPKLMWQERCGKENHKNDRFVLNDMEFHSIDLLDISRIIPLNNVDRRIYPFVKKTRTFAIYTCEKEILFEAETTKQRDHFVKGLKILVARLGSKIIVGDKNILEEFFTPSSSQVPGHAPDILTT